MISNHAISVVMPVYNDAPFLNEAIDSILNQTYTDFKFIIVNDGSTDTSGEIIKSYNDPRIKYIENTNNMGIAFSLNLGIGNAKSEFIARIDSNDSAFPSRLEKQYLFLINNPNYGMVTSPVIHQSEDGSEIISGGYIPDMLIPATLLFRNCVFHSAVMYRKSAIPIAGYNEKCAAEDYDLWAKMIFNWKINIFKDPLTKVRELKSGLRFNPQNKIDSIEIRKKILREIGITLSDEECNYHELIKNNNRKLSFFEICRFILYLEKLRNGIISNNLVDLFSIDNIIISTVRNLFKSTINPILVIFYIIKPLNLKNIPLISCIQVLKVFLRSKRISKREIFENQYTANKWNYLSRINELGHYSIIIGYIKYYFSNPIILDVGCGTGILFSRFDSNTYAKYVGVDISRQAINQFDKIKNNKTTLLQLDLESFRSNEKFDVIIFCESLYYSNNPQKILNKYAKYLSKKGKIIISIFEEDKTVKFWKYIPSNFQLIDATKLQNKNDSSWRIKLFEVGI